MNTCSMMRSVLQFARPFWMSFWTDDEERREAMAKEAKENLALLEAQLRVVREQILEKDRRVRASARETELGRT